LQTTWARHWDQGRRVPRRDRRSSPAASEALRW
jgi:hypothetical protein